ncbi:MAG TPA: PKD domain-containing protein [Patescibacteria group bacterium]|nr:PKD domain-containing protein [Patescibacteria group bacterium]
MKKLVLTFLFVFGLFFYLPQSNVIFAAIGYGSGIYTNLCGSGTNGQGDTCTKGCDTTQGACTSTGPFVVKYSCDGKQVSCKNNVSHFDTTQTVAGAACGTTTEIDVYKKSCQTLFGWFCNDGDRVDYLTWYAGDCNGSSTSYMGSVPTTPTPAPAEQSSCTSLSVTKGNNSLIPATVSFAAQGTDSAGPISDYLYYFGDGQEAESPSNTIDHRFDISGSFTAKVFIKDAAGNWKSSSTCETTVSVSASPLETQKSACSNLFILSGNYTQAPSTVTFRVTGYDNKGGIKQYKVDFGNGQTQESTNGLFSSTYNTAGTYTIHGYVLDSQNIWTGANDTCTRTLYIETQSLTSQPNTGSPTWFTIVAIVGGITGISLVLSGSLSTQKVVRKRTHKKSRSS